MYDGEQRTAQWHALREAAQATVGRVFPAQRQPATSACCRVQPRLNDVFRGRIFAVVTVDNNP